MQVQILSTPPYLAVHCLLPAGCEKTTSSYLWLFVLVGNLLRGVGEAPVMPLGMTYIDDFSREENSAFYIGKNK